MEISLALILDELELEADINTPDGVNPKFSSVELYVSGEKQTGNGKLLVCTLSEAIAAEKHDGMFFLCVRDGHTENHAVNSELNCITVVHGSLSLYELFNRVARIFTKVMHWVMAMERSAAKHRGLQELIDFSESIFRNFITIQDSTFKLVAYTKNISPPSKVMSSLVLHGYHPPETMELFKRHRRVEEFRTNTEVLVSRDYLTSDFEIVKKTFHLGGSIFIMVVMECCNKPANNATVELFDILISYIKAYADHDIAQTGGVGGVKALALDILNKNVGSREEARVRSTYCGYPFEGGFRMYVFSFEDEENVPIANVIHNLTEACTDSVPLFRKGKVLMIEFQRADIAGTCKNAEKALDKVGFTCGISNDFDSLWELPTAYEQAIIAADVSSRLKPAAYAPNSSNFRLFTDYILYHIVSAGFRTSPEALSTSFMTSSIDKLRKYDDYHRTETMRILRIFLENDRNATATASIMHMHRNTILYHMDKVGDFLGISLDAPDTRLQLMLAFKADDFRTLL